MDSVLASEDVGQSSSVSIGERLRQVRMLKGLSQVALAREIGVSYQQLQKYEKGLNRLSVPRLLDISKVLKVDVSVIARPDEPIALTETAIPERDLAAHDGALEQLGPRLRLLREYCGLTQGELASRIGVSHQQVQKYESGKNQISLPRLMEISRVLGVDVKAIIGPQNPLIGLSKTVDVDRALRDPRISALLRYFSAIKTDEMRDEVITHAKRLADLT